MVVAPTELRANWVAHDSIQTAAGRKSMILKMTNASLNTAFVEAPPIGDNYGEGGTEAFISFLNSAKAEGLTVFGWISNHKRTYPVPADLRLGGERLEQAKWVNNLIREFPCIDGVAIDYIRYPDWEASDSEKIDGVTLTIKAIRKVTDNANVSLLSTSFPAATITYRGLEPSWEGGVPIWFQEWYTANPSNYFKLEASSGGTGIVNQGNLDGPNPGYLLGPSFMSYQQDPITWIADGFVDHVVPMQYTSDPAVMRNDIDVWDSFMSWIGHPLTSIHLGLGWMDEPSSFPDSKFDPAAMISHVKYGQAKGVGGYTIFRLGIPGIDDQPLIDALTIPNSDNGWAPPFTTKTISPFPFVDRVCGKAPESIGSSGTAESSDTGPSNTRRAGTDSSTFWIASLVLACFLQRILLG